KDTTENFRLRDMWDCYEEWSAYGVGVPLTLNNQSVIQYYTPYLSAIQLYTVQSPTTLRSPIGYIPLIGLRKKAPTYFITYHTISSLFQENTNDETKEGVSMLKKKNGGIPIPPFGIASYKMQNDVWMNKAQANTIYDDLHGAANCWLNQLNYYHHDFNVFTSNDRNLDYIYLF
ncbi:hypothetical protein MTR67_000207, partial [Solanum verrucosum]